MYLICTTDPRIFAYSSGLGKFLQPFPVFWCVFLSSICCLYSFIRLKPATLAVATALVRARVPNASYPSCPTPLVAAQIFCAPTTQRNESRRIRNCRCNLLMQPEDPTKGYLTIILLVRVGCEMEDSQRGEEHLISNKREWKKNAHKISRILPDVISKNDRFSACF